MIDVENAGRIETQLTRLSDQSEALNLIEAQNKVKTGANTRKYEEAQIDERWPSGVRARQQHERNQPD